MWILKHKGQGNPIPPSNDVLILNVISIENFAILVF